MNRKSRVSDRHGTTPLLYLRLFIQSLSEGGECGQEERPELYGAPALIFKELPDSKEIRRGSLSDVD